ncbi:hypothetical protein FQA39_LY04019 [Lamprigera yunnana]|nr:hypothetical protein FQA39_LY04019 [Lamprigera yunnana]
MWSFTMCVIKVACDQGVAIAGINKETEMEALQDLNKELGESKVIFDEIDVSSKHQFEGNDLNDMLKNISSSCCVT